MSYFEKCRMVWKDRPGIGLWKRGSSPPRLTPELPEPICYVRVFQTVRLLTTYRRPTTSDLQNETDWWALVLRPSIAQLERRCKIAICCSVLPRQSASLPRHPKMDRARSGPGSCSHERHVVPHRSSRTPFRVATVEPSAVDRTVLALSSHL